TRRRTRRRELPSSCRRMSAHSRCTSVPRLGIRLAFRFSSGSCSCSSITPATNSIRLGVARSPPPPALSVPPRPVPVSLPYCGSYSRDHVDFQRKNMSPISGRFHKGFGPPRFHKGAHFPWPVLTVARGQLGQ